MEKFWRICVLIALIALFIVAAAEEEPMARDITGKCGIPNRNGSLGKALDKNVRSCWTSRSGYSDIKITIPENETVDGMLIEWYKPFEKFDLFEYDKDGNEIRLENSEEYFKGYVTWLDLLPETKSIVFRVYKEGQISELSVYSEGVNNPDIQKWKNPAEKIDIMLLVAHQDDEVLWFGGLLPYYNTVRDKNVQVVFMVSCGRSRIREALNCIWTMGIDTIPEIIGYKDSYETGKKAVEVWGGESNIEKSLVRRIRRYRPEVIVTHDINGEYGHPQHKLIASSIVKAVKSAANAENHSDSARLYGAWSTKKVYLHLGDTETIYMDWTTPHESLGGKTPIELAEAGYRQHVSQQSAFSMDRGKYKYDYTKFSLVYSTVGKDVLKNDFLENTDAAN